MDPEDEPIWCRIELTEVANIVNEYRLLKDGPWYHEVDWAKVSAALDRLLQANTLDGVVPDLGTLVDGELHALRRVDAEGVMALTIEPMTATRVQVTNGGHRLRAMLRKGVTKVPGTFLRGDVGSSVSAQSVYPLALMPE